MFAPRSFIRHSTQSLVCAIGFALVQSACGDPRPAVRMRAALDERPVADAAPPPATFIDTELPPPGIPDRGRTPGVVLLEADGVPRCAGVLVASNLVLAPISCVTEGRRCTPAANARLAILSGDEAHETFAHARAILAADSCDDDALAAIVLTRHADGIAPLPIRARPAAAGEFVRTIGIASIQPMERTLRDHLRVETSARSNFRLRGDACAFVPGTIALDEATGELVGVFVRPVAACDVGVVDFVPIDLARTLLEAALARAAEPRALADGGFVDGGLPRRGKAVRPTTDLGDACEAAAGCAAGVCVLDPMGGYCSRPCGPNDRCPTGLRCERKAEAESVCLRTR